MRDFYRRTHDLYVEQVNDRYGGRFSIVGTYVNDTTRIEHRCPDHGLFWQIPKRMLTARKHACPHCGWARIRKALGRTHAEYEALVRKKFGDRVTVVEPYVNAKTPIRHLVDGREWRVVPDEVLNKHQFKRVPYSEADYRVALATHLTLVGPWQGLSKRARHRCETHGIEWDGLPHMLLKKPRCPTCAREYQQQQRYAFRTITFGGREFEIQGYEDVVLAHLVMNERIDPERIQAGVGHRVPSVSYRYEGTNRFYLADAYIADQHTLIETKSDYTLGRHHPEYFSQNQAKGRAVLAKGYGLRLFVVSKDRARISEIFAGWTEWDHADLLFWLNSLPL